MGDRLSGVIERAAGGLLALVTALTFVSVVLRYVFNWSIPDSYDLGRNLLGILIFWGIAVAGYRGAHITIDLLWNALPRRAQGRPGRVLDLVLALAMGALAWAGFAVGFVLALLRLFRNPTAAEPPPPRL